MKTRDYCVSFETVTPLWFGNSWSENAAPIKTSSLMGSLRFWFEVICYFSGITTNKDYVTDKEHKRTIFKADLSAKEFPEKLVASLNKKLATDTNINDLVHEVLTSLSIPLPARVFGCTGWQGLIKVKEVKFENDNYGRPNIPFKRIGIPKRGPNGKILINNECPKRSDQDYSVYYFPEAYYGNFNVVFNTDEETMQHIFYPLLKFIENYGFLGKGWNLGYGRIKVYFADGEKQYDRFSNYAEFRDNPIEFNKIVEYTRKLEDFLPKEKALYEKKLFIWDKTENGKDIEIGEIIKELIREKFFMRRSVTNRIKRHLVFGTISSPSHGSKILPWIYKDGKKFNYGFASIAGILNISGEEKKKEG